MHKQKTKTMAYKPNFKWNDELALEFAKLSTMGSYGLFEDTRSIEDKLTKFKAYVEQRKREEKIKRVVIGKRGMNEDGSRFYYDCRGVKWNIKRIELNMNNSYIAESEIDETIHTTFLGDVYLDIDRKAEGILNKEIEKNFAKNLVD